MFFFSTNDNLGLRLVVYYLRHEMYSFENTKIIHLLQLTGKDGFTVETFSKRYIDFENKDCPFRINGHLSLEQFLRSMPDIGE